MKPQALRLAAGGGPLSVRRFAPEEARRGGLVLLPDEGGRQAALVALAAGFAAEGYEAVATGAVGADAGTAARVQACIDMLAPPVMLLGLGEGGAAAWRAIAAGAGAAAASVFYPADLEALAAAAAPPRSTILHVGKRDPAFTPAAAARLAAAQPELPVYPYETAAGFVDDEDAPADAVRLALLRTRALFTRAVGRSEMGG